MACSFWRVSEHNPRARCRPWPNIRYLTIQHLQPTAIPVFLAILIGVPIGVLLAFPELSLTDYLSRPDASRLTRRLEDAEPVAIAQAAGDMTVSSGMMQGEGGNIFNAQMLVSGADPPHVLRRLNLPQCGNLCDADHDLPGAGCRWPTPHLAVWRR